MYVNDLSKCIYNFLTKKILSFEILHREIK